MYGGIWIDRDNGGGLLFQDHNGTWGAVCTSGFDDYAADVACRQLGYVRSYYTYTYYPRYVPNHKIAT